MTRKHRVRSKKKKIKEEEESLLGDNKYVGARFTTDGPNGTDLWSWWCTSANMNAFLLAAFTLAVSITALVGVFMVHSANQIDSNSVTSRLDALDTAIGTVIVPKLTLLGSVCTTKNAVVFNADSFRYVA